MNNDNPIDRDLASAVREKGGNISAVSRAYGVSFEYLKSLAERDLPTAFQPTFEPIPTDIKSLGKPGFERFVIAVKKRGTFPWPVEFAEAIREARRKFDAGTHEMYQTTNRGFIVQYLVPRRRPVEPRRFFRSLPIV